MSDHLSALDDDTIHWVKATSKNGVSFEFGTKKTENDATEGKSKIVVSKVNEDFGISVDWKVQQDDPRVQGIPWNDTVANVKRTTGISRWRLYEYHGYWKYRLEFTNDVGYYSYTYHFLDETGDSYRVGTSRQGDHYLRYDSSKPNIKFVTGT